jgi:hypothetical protein
MAGFRRSCPLARATRERGRRGRCCNRWLRSGLRECVASVPKQRVESLRAIRKGKFTPLEKLLVDAGWDEELARQKQKGDQAGVSAALQSVHQLDLAALQAKWGEHYNSKK